VEIQFNSSELYQIGRNAFPNSSGIRRFAFFWLLIPHHSHYIQAFSSGITDVSIHPHSAVHSQNLAEHSNLNISQCSQYKLKEPFDLRKITNIMDSADVCTKSLL
jgi:hypothetical protein